MKRYDFLISYDISDPRRLRKIAREIEKKALRIQFSVYVLFDATKEELSTLLERITKICNENEDDIRVYKISHYGVKMGCAIDLNNPYDFF